VNISRCRVVIAEASLPLPTRRSGAFGAASPEQLIASRSWSVCIRAPEIVRDGPSKVTEKGKIAPLIEEKLSG